MPLLTLVGLGHVSGLGVCWRRCAVHRVLCGNSGECAAVRQSGRAAPTRPPLSPEYMWHGQGSTCLLTQSNANIQLGTELSPKGPQRSLNSPAFAGVWSELARVPTPIGAWDAHLLSTANHANHTNAACRWAVLTCEAVVCRQHIRLLAIVAGHQGAGACTICERSIWVVDSILN